MSTIYRGRTVSICSPFKTTQVTGNNGVAREYSSIFFKLAVQRNYSVPSGKFDENGQPIMERPTDFFFCKATGKVAEYFNERCTAQKQVVDANGQAKMKLDSKLIYVEGNWQTYSSTRKENVQLNGQVYPIELPTTEHVFVVDRFDIIEEYKRANTGHAVAGNNATPIMVAPTAIPATAPAQAIASAPAQAAAMPAPVVMQASANPEVAPWS